MLKLFKIERGKGQEPLYFDNKKNAKDERDKLTAAGKSAQLRRGPDHRRGETFA